MRGSLNIHFEILRWHDDAHKVGVLINISSNKDFDVPLKLIKIIKAT